MSAVGPAGFTAAKVDSRRIPRPAVTLQGFATPRTVEIGLLTFTRINPPEIRVGDGNLGRQPSHPIADRALPGIRTSRLIINRVIYRATGSVRDGTAQDITQVFHSNDNTGIGRPLFRRYSRREWL